MNSIKGFASILLNDFNENSERSAGGFKNRLNKNNLTNTEYAAGFNDPFDFEVISAVLLGKFTGWGKMYLISRTWAAVYAY